MKFWNPTYTIAISIFYITLVFGLNSCSGGGNGNDSAVTPTEKWGGAYASNYSYITFGAITLYLNRDGTSVTGRYETTAGGAGTVNGTITNTTVNLTLVQSAAINCPGEFSVNGEVSSTGKDITANFFGRDCNGQYSGPARILAIPPESAGSDFTGNYYGDGIRSYDFLSISTQNGVDYSGSASFIIADFFRENLKLITADVKGSLGNDNGESLIRMDLTNIVTEEEPNYDTGFVKFLDMYQDNKGLNRLRASASFRLNGGGVSHNMEMLQLK